MFSSVYCGNHVSVFMIVMILFTQSLLAKEYTGDSTMEDGASFRTEINFEPVSNNINVISQSSNLPSFKEDHNSEQFDDAPTQKFMPKMNSYSKNPDMGSFPSMGNMGNFPSMGNMGNMGNMGGFPSMGNIGNMPQMPQMPQMPATLNLPNMPNMPNLASMPQMNSFPSMQSFQNSFDDFTHDEGKDFFYKLSSNLKLDPSNTFNSPFPEMEDTTQQSGRRSKNMIPNIPASMSQFPSASSSLQSQSQNIMSAFDTNNGPDRVAPVIPEMAKFENFSPNDIPGLAEDKNIVPPMFGPDDPLPSIVVPEKVEIPTTKSLDEMLGFPSVSGTFDSLGKKFNAAQKAWGTYFGQQNIQEEVIVGENKVDIALRDAEETKKELIKAGLEADSTIKAEQEAIAQSKSASESANKALEDELSFKNDALEAKRWMEKIVEKSELTSTESQEVKEKVEKAQKLVDEALAKDSKILEKMKEISEKSSKTVQETEESKSMLLALQQKEREAHKELEKGNASLKEMQEEEERIRKFEEELTKKLDEEKLKTKKQIEESESIKQSYQSKIEDLTKQLNDIKKQKEESVIDLQKLNNELKVAKDEEHLKEEKIKINEENFAKEAEEQTKMINEALEAVRKAKETAITAANQEKEAENKAKNIEKEIDLVNAKMREKLEIARKRTKEWLHKQTAEMTQKSQIKDFEIKRLQFELERVEKEEKEQRQALKKQIKEQMEKIESHVKQSQPQALQPQVAQPQVAQPQVAQPQAAQPQAAQPQAAQPQAAQPQAAQPQAQTEIQSKLKKEIETQKKVVEAQKNSAIQQQQLLQQQLRTQLMNWQNQRLFGIDALQLEEQSEPSSQSVMTKQDIYDKLTSVHKKLENLLGKTGEMPSIPEVDLERVSNSDYKLTRRESKKISQAIGNALPSGYPPPPSTSKLQAGMINLEIGEGLVNQEDNQSITAQGVNDPSDVLNMSNAHKKNCLKICSGGDRTVYRDGVVSTVPEESSTQHETGACMKMCAMFVIEAQEKCSDPTKC